MPGAAAPIPAAPVPAGPRTGVLVTRPEPGNSETCALLRARGHHPVAAGLISIEPRPPRPVPGQPQAVLVTSAHALGALDPAAVPVLLAVGDSTASRARALGVRDSRSAGGDASDLLALCRDALRPERGALLLLSGQGHGLALAAGLRQSGFQVNRRVAYRQRVASRMPPCALAALQADTLAAILFMSGSAARAFSRLLPARLHPALAGIAALAISAEAARPVSALPWLRVRVALRPTAEDVLALL